MSTDEMIEQENQGKIPPFGAEIPFEQPKPPVVEQPRKKRFSSIFHRLRQKKAKAQNILNAVEFAGLLQQAGTNQKATVKSIKLQHGLSTRTARRIVRDGKPKKHRKRR